MKQESRDLGRGEVVRPAKAGMFSGSQSHQGKNQSLVAGSAGGKETELLKPDDKTAYRVVRVIGP